MRSLKLKSANEWTLYKAGKLSHLPPKPNNIPCQPHRIYKGQWVSMYDWIGGGKRQKGWRSFEEARTFVRNLRLNSLAQWRKYCKGEMPHLPPRPDDIPNSPEIVYADKWISNYDWIGNGKKQGNWQSFEQARDFARNLHLKTFDEWHSYCRGKFPHLPPKPDDIPTSPERVYKREWSGVPDWLGAGRRIGGWRTFEEAREFAQSLHLKGEYDWRKYCAGSMKNLPKLPNDVPRSAHLVYKSEWLGWGDWLGSGRRRGGWRSFKEARAFARGLKLKGEYEWKRYCRGELVNFPPKPDDMPRNPYQVYASEWINWYDWVGAGKRQGGWRSFEKARKFVHDLRLSGSVEWNVYCRMGIKGLPNKPHDIPASPWIVYKDDWVNLADWLGNRSMRGGDIFLKNITSPP